MLYADERERLGMLGQPVQRRPDVFVRVGTLCRFFSWFFILAPDQGKMLNSVIAMNLISPCRNPASPKYAG